MLSWTRGDSMEPDSLDTMSKSDILRGIIVEKLSTAAREILAVVERTVTDYEEEASGFRQEIDRQRRQLELLQPEIKQETSDEQQICSVSEARGSEPLEEEELHKYEPSEEDSESLGIVCYTEQQVEEEEHEDEEEIEVDEDDEEEEEDQASLGSSAEQLHFTEPDYEAAPRVLPPTVQPDRRSVGRLRISDSQTLIDLRIRILEDSDIDVLSTGVFQKYPAHELQCPRGLQEEDFLLLLRSSFPQLAAGEPFDVFTTDRTKRLLPLEVDRLTPEEIYGTIRSNGNSALYIRLKKPKEAPSAEFVPSQTDAAAAEPSSSSDQTRKHSRRKPGRPRISDTQTHIHLRVRILEASQTDVLSASVFQKFPVQELQCPRGLQESDFLDLLRSSFPQLADGEPFDVFSTDRTRRLQPLSVETLTPEEISRAIRSTGNSALYIRLKSTGELQPKEEETLQSEDAEDDPSTPTTSRQISRVQSDRRRRGKARNQESDSHIDLKVRILEDSQINVMSPIVFQKFPVQELQCPRGLQESDFLDLLRSSFPQLADGEPFDAFTTDGLRRLQPLKVERLTPEEISRATKSTGVPVLYIRLKTKTKPSVFYAKLAGGPRSRVPPEDSDDSCLSDSDEEYVQKPGDEDGGRESSNYGSSSDEDLDGHQDQDAPAAREKSAASPRTKRPAVVWKTVEQSQDSAKPVPVWRAALPDSDSVRLPIDYFRQFFDSELLDVIVKQSNLYCTQQNPDRALKLDQQELEQFIGTVVYMSVVHLPRSRMFWSSACRVQQVADVMSRNRWEEIKQFIHFSDNTAPSSSDRLFKIRPLIDSLLPKFEALPRDQMLSVDEHMVPFKGRSVLKQYIPKKPYKWGYKIFVLCDSRGLVHSFDVFAGRTDPVPGAKDIGPSGNIVLKLAQVIDGSVNHLLYVGDWCASLDLFVALANRGIPALGAVQQSGLHGCSFSPDTELKKRGRGTFEEQEAAVDGVEIRAVKWFDNRGLIAASTFASAQPVSITERWDRQLKRKVSVECPSIIALHDKFKGGADALDALMAHYRIHVRSKKYYHRFFFHFVDMVIVNSWLLYRRDCESVSVPRKKQMDLLDFRTSIAQALCMQGKDLWTKKRGRPWSDVGREFEKKKRRGPAKAIPAQEVRSDAVGHWPVVDSGRQCCKFPRCSGHTGIKCAKCDVHLCLNKNKNCFCAFHE